jgi:uncharacterized protein (TIGR00255 family)
MIRSMTGFGRARGFIPSWGRVSLEIRSTNHRFLDIVLHLPEGFLYLEQRLKEAVGRRIKRGHIICRLEVNPLKVKKPILNKNLIKEYYLSLKQVAARLNLNEDININTLATLPGIWSVQSQSCSSLNWDRVKPLVKKALDRLIKRRQQEGRVLYRDLVVRAQRTGEILGTIKRRFKKVIKQRLSLYKTEEEKNGFLRGSDINEEVVRLGSHLRNCTHCLNNKRAVGKELDFILQEMQREANTIGAKSVDAIISNKVIGMKSEIEKMREQVQNVE